MARGSINLTVTPGAEEIVQGQRANTKRPEADRVSEIAGALSGYEGETNISTDELSLDPRQKQ